MTLMKFLLFILCSVAFSAHAQISDVSFFPMMSSINPGVIHMRRGGLIAADHQRNTIEKDHQVTGGGIEDGIQTEVKTSSYTGFMGISTRPVSFELMYKQASGTKDEQSESSTHGDLSFKNDASAGYARGVLDFRFFGVSYAKTDFEYQNMYKLIEGPSVARYDETIDLAYQDIKVGTAIKIGPLRLGGYYLQQSATGNYNYQPYDAATGAALAPTKSPAKIQNKGAGGALGFTLPTFRMELGFEKLMAGSMKIDSAYPLAVKKPDNAERSSVVVEAKLFSWLNLGLRYRRIKGNYIDLEDILTYHLLYSDLGPDDIRNEIIYNFSFGDSEGFSPSFFIMSSSVTTQEPSPLAGDDEDYKAKTTATSAGVTLLYRF